MYIIFTAALFDSPHIVNRWYPRLHVYEKIKYTDQNSITFMNPLVPH